MLPTGWLETASESSHFSHDISKMPDDPPKYTGHRRAHSEIFTLPDDISFDSDLGVVGGFDGHEETEEDLYSMYLDMDNKSGSQVVEEVQTSRTTTATTPPAMPPSENHVNSFSDRPKVKHLHSMSMDFSTAFNAEDTPLTDAKKSMSAAKLDELALVDPKRAKRIWANRQSAARSKERKMRYIAELEREVQILQTNATSLSTQLTLLQRDVHGLTVENNELRLRLQTMEQQVHLQDAVTDELKKEIHHLNLLTGQNLTNGGPMVNFPQLFRPNQRFNPNNQPVHTMLTAQQFHQLQIQSRNQHHRPFRPPQLHRFQQQPPLHQFQQQQKQQQRNLG
ncbi:putative transcription factor bZIP family [Helianthus anomalus]